MLKTDEEVKALFRERIKDLTEAQAMDCYKHIGGITDLQMKCNFALRELQDMAHNLFGYDFREELDELIREIRDYVAQYGELPK